MRSVTITLATLVGTVVAALISGAIALCEANLYVPHKASENLPSSRLGDWRDVSVIARDGISLAAWFVKPSAKTHNCVVVLHGVGDSRVGSAGYASIFLSSGYNVLLPDSRGHGASGGDIVTYGIREKFDVTSWIAWLRKQGCQRIFGLGESLGGAVLIQAAAVTHDLSAIVAESSYSDLKSVAGYRVGRMIAVPRVSEPVAALMVGTAMQYARVRYGVNLEEVSPISAIGQIRTPILLVHGLADTETPPGESVELANRNSRAVLWLVPHAKHVGAYSANPAMFGERVLSWFAEHAD
ncbi:MAG TPA: alpha/beta fold hydrolase [Bryobacteraceae bacterium]|nr:alpha/beta fold hydrolase [Bryobacteraceae bacterium]